MTRKRLSRLGALVLGMVMLAVSPAGAQPSWVQVPSPNVSPGSNELSGVAAAGANSVWAVGRVIGDANPRPVRSVVLRWNGTAWSVVDHPRPGLNQTLVEVDAPATNDAWAVGWSQPTSTSGVRTLIEHWDGTSWSVVASPSPNGNSVLNGVKAVPSDPGTVWAVGSYIRPNVPWGDLPLVLRRTGGSWQVVPSPAVTTDNHLEAVDATGPRDAWAVGWGISTPFGGAAVAIVQRWNGTRWDNVPLPNPSPIMLFGVEALGPNDVWAVGHTYQGGAHWIPLILHWNGATWTRATIPIPQYGGQLHDIVALSPTNIYATGFAGEYSNAETYVLHWNGVSWTRETTPSPRVGPKLYGAAAITPSTVWAVGNRYDQASLENRTLAIRTTNG